MSRIYIVKARKSGDVVRYVRANNLNAAVRALAEERYEASAATTEEIFQAAKADKFHVLDAVKSQQADLGLEDPAPAALRAV